MLFSSKQVQLLRHYATFCHLQIVYNHFILYCWFLLVFIATSCGWKYQITKTKNKNNFILIWTCSRYPIIHLIYTLNIFIIYHFRWILYKYIEGVIQKISSLSCVWIYFKIVKRSYTLLIIFCFILKNIFVSIHYSIDFVYELYLIINYIKCLRRTTVIM